MEKLSWCALHLERMFSPSSRESLKVDKYSKEPDAVSVDIIDSERKLVNASADVEESAEARAVSRAQRLTEASPCCCQAEQKQE